MDAAAHYAERIDAVDAQRQRVGGRRPEGDTWAKIASRFVMDPRRELDPNLAIVAEYARPEDVIVDVGGGAGRVSLPLALRCREVINVEPSAGMCAAFQESARGAGIENARAIEASWPVEGVEGDLTMVFNVTYFVREIVPFIEELVRASRRRVMIGVWSVPPPAQDVKLFELVYGEPGEAAPSYRELLPVLWEMGILPDVRVLPNEFRSDDDPQTRDDAIQYALGRLEFALDGDPGGRAREVISTRFDDLFQQTDSGYRPSWRPPAREMLITWETR
jgi:SAM-dependent methyltransferase